MVTQEATSIRTKFKVFYERVTFKRTATFERGLHIGDSQPMGVGVYSDATRPSTADTGTVIFNTTDANLNTWDGSQWILPNGSAT